MGHILCARGRARARARIPSACQDRSGLGRWAGPRTLLASRSFIDLSSRDMLDPRDPRLLRLARQSLAEGVWHQDAWHQAPGSRHRDVWHRNVWHRASDRVEAT